MIEAAISLAVVALCAVLNRVRGGGLGGERLPGRPLFWVAPAIGGLSALFLPWTAAVAMALGYAFWGAFSWGYTLALVGGFVPPREPTKLEAALIQIAPPEVVVFLRMMFITPGVLAVAFLIGSPLFIVAAPVFSLLAVVLYAELFRPISSLDWQRAEIGTGALWGLVIVSAHLLSAN